MSAAAVEAFRAGPAPSADPPAARALGLAGFVLIGAAAGAALAVGVAERERPRREGPPEARALHAAAALLGLAVLADSAVEHYRVKVEAWMANDVYPYIGGRPVAELTAPEFLRVGRRMEERGALESAHRVLQTCGQVMRYAIATGRADRNPVADLKGAIASPAERHHAAITDPAVLGGLLRAIEGYTGDITTRAALQLSAPLFVRPGELRHTFAQGTCKESCREEGEWKEVDLYKAPPSAGLLLSGLLVAQVAT